MANDHHDEHGRFCSAGEEKVAQDKVVNLIGAHISAGNINTALDLQQQFNQLWPEKTTHTAEAFFNRDGTPNTDREETKDFDSIRVGGFIDKAKNIFTKRTPYRGYDPEQPASDGDFDDLQTYLAENPNAHWDDLI